LLGLAFDEPAADVLLFGEVVPGDSALHLPDLVVALRNAWLAYVQQKGSRITYLHPGVSLEPAPANLKELRDIAGDIARIRSAGSEKALERWKEVCRRPYKVVVAGLPPDSRFARTLLEADYAMKALANGSEGPPVPGFPGMAELRRIRHQEGSGPPPPSLTRYWFHPGNQEWETGDGIVVLKRCPVALLTEAAFAGLGADGAPAPPEDELSEAFAYGFTRMYDEVAAARPVFRELGGLFRLVAAAKLVRDRYGEGEAATLFPALLRGHAPEAAAGAPREGVPGRPDLQHFDVSRPTPMGMEIDRHWLPSCGGVNVAVEPAKAWLRRLRDPRLPAFRKAAVDARPVPGAGGATWWWDVSGPALAYWDALRERMRLQELGRRFPDLAFFRLRRAGEGEARALELVDEDDLVVRRAPAAGVLEEIASRADARKVRSVFLELNGWPAEEAGAFRAAAAEFALRRQAAWVPVPVVDRPGWLSPRNPLFASGAEWDTGEPVLSPVSAGAYKGWHRVTFRFRASVGGRAVPASLHVMVRSAETAARLQEEGAGAFRARLFIAYSPLSALSAVLSEFREALPPSERKDVRIVEDEAGNLPLG
jgi:hypothetical protein